MFVYIRTKNIFAENACGKINIKKRGNYKISIMSSLSSVM